MMAASDASRTLAKGACADTREQCSIRRPPTGSSLLEGVVQRGTGRSVLAVGKPLAGQTSANEARTSDSSASR
jgi:hypothetical protein